VKRRRFLVGAAASGAGVVLTGRSAPPGWENGPATAAVPASPKALAAAAPRRVLRGDQPQGFTVPAGEVWGIAGLVTTPANVVVRGKLVNQNEQGARVPATLRFRNVREAAMRGGADALLASDVGLWVVDHGEVELRGAPKTAWTRAVGALAARQSVIDVASAAGWRPGDKLVFTPTVRWGSANGRVTNFYDRYDTRTIVRVAGNRVTVSPLSHPHPFFPGTRIGCEVLNLTRDTKLEGTAAGRSHATWMHAHQPVRLSHVEVSLMGVPGRLGRYPLHWHLMGNGARGSLVEGVVVHDCGNHAFVPHTSHGMTLRTCVAHNLVGDAYWWDLDAFTNASVWDRCVASRVGSGGRVAGFNLGLHDRRVANAINTVRGCVAVGMLDDDYDLAGLNSNDNAGFTWPEIDIDDVSEEFLGTPWVFDANVAHNCGGNGMFVWQNDSHPHLVSRARVFNCSVGINHGAYGNNYVYRDVIMRGVHRAIWQHASSGGRMSYERVDAAVLGPQAVQLNSATGGLPSDPIDFRSCRFTGYTQVGVRASGEGGGPADDEFPAKADFHDTVWQPGRPKILVTAGAPAGTTVREFRGGRLTGVWRR
jgi:hypothetical protein